MNTINTTHTRPMLVDSVGCNVNVSNGLGSLMLNRRQRGLYWELAPFELLAYGASRAALGILTVQLALELRATDMNVNPANREASSRKARMQ